jgi:hypothetical protein
MNSQLLRNCIAHNFLCKLDTANQVFTMEMVVTKINRQQQGKCLELGGKAYGV